MKGVLFHHLAEKELQDAACFYEKQTQGLGDSFLDEIYQNLERILNYPDMGVPPYYASSIRATCYLLYTFQGLCKAISNNLKSSVLRVTNVSSPRIAEAAIKVSMIGRVNPFLLNVPNNSPQ